MPHKLLDANLLLLFAVAAAAAGVAAVAAAALDVAHLIGKTVLIKEKFVLFRS